MQLRSKYGEYYTSLDDVPGAIKAFEKRILFNIVRNDTRYNGDRFELKGLRRRYDFCSMSLEPLVEDYLKLRLKRALSETRNEFVHLIDFESKKATVLVLMDMLRRLMPNYRYHLDEYLRELLEGYTLFLQFIDLISLTYSPPLVIDWEDGSFTKILTEIIKQRYNPTEAVAKISNLVSVAVLDKYEELEEG